MIEISHYLILATCLFFIGLVGILLRRNLIIVFMSIELMLNAINLLLVAFSAMHQNADGQVFVFFVMVIAACEAAVGLALIIALFKHFQSMSIDQFSNVKEQL